MNRLYVSKSGSEPALRRLVVVTVLIAAAAADVSAREYVADPFRSVGVTWPKHEVKGRDYWLYLFVPMAELGQKDLKGEKFIEDSGTTLFYANTPEYERKDPWGIPGPDDRLKWREFKPTGWLKERLETKPFDVLNHYEIRFLPEENVDNSAVDKLFEEYPDTFMGPRFNEWDAGLLHCSHRYQSDGFKEMIKYSKLPCDRMEMRENFHRRWLCGQLMNGKRMFGLSGCTEFMHWGCEWGGRVSCVEICGDPEFPHRNNIMFARSASRQFDVPMSIYTAYYRFQYHPSSRGMGAEAGQETSLSWRQHLNAYYMGNNFQQFESQPWGQCDTNAEGRVVLSPNGLEIRDLYNWTMSPEGRRGTAYTPVLFLLDRAHGYDQLMNIGMYKDKGAFHGCFPPSPADYYTDYAMRAITPRYNCLVGQTVPDKSAGMRNSPIGDIFDVYIANSDVKGRELRRDQLAKYSVVMPLSDILWTNDLANKLKRYVAEGGTLVLTAGHVAPFKDDAVFLGGRFAKGEYSKDDILVNVYGNGRVVLICNPFMQQEKDPWVQPEAMKKLLLDIQSEVVPFPITGECSFTYNRMNDGSWKAIIMNNAGTIKLGNEKNFPPRPEWQRTVTLELPESASFEEVLLKLEGRVERRNGRQSVSFDIPSGRVIVVNVKGVVTPEPIKAKPFTVDPVENFADQVYVPHPVYDRCSRDPAKGGYKDTAPAVIWDWVNPDPEVQFMTNLFQGGVSNQRKDDSNEYPLPRATFDLEAKYTGGAIGARNSGVLLYAAENIGIGIEKDGSWYAFTMTGQVWNKVYGPKATGDWQKVRLQFDTGTLRFYVDGTEFRDPKKGRLRTKLTDCRNAFYDRLMLCVGEQIHGWGNIFPGLVKSCRITSNADERFEVWPQGKMPTPQEKYLTNMPYCVWWTPKTRKTDAVCICISGGGYERNGIGGFEVSPIRDYLLEKGMNVVTFKYRTPRPDGSVPFYLPAWQDAQRVVRLVRREAKKRGLNPENIGWTGGSAGGHLTLCTALSSETRTYEPVDEIDSESCHLNWAVPIYAAHVLKDQSRLWGPNDWTDFTVPFDESMKFDGHTPPLCMFVGDKDEWAINSLRVYQKLHLMKIPCELHVLSDVGHCFQMPSRLKENTPSAMWKDVFWAWLVQRGYVEK